MSARIRHLYDLLGRTSIQAAWERAELLNRFSRLRPSHPGR